MQCLTGVIKRIRGTWQRRARPAAEAPPFGFEPLEPRTLLSADVTITSVTGPDFARWREAVTLNYTVTNQGSSAFSGYWQDAIYLSDDTLLDETDLLLIDEQPSAGNNVGPGGQYVDHIGAIIPAGHPGDHYLLLKIDSEDRRGESDKSNNVAAVPIHIADGPDMVFSNLTAPASAVWGQVIEFGWTIENRGESFSNGAVAVYISDDAALDPSDVRLSPEYNGHPYTGGAGRPGGRATTSGKYRMPARSSTQQYLLVAMNQNVGSDEPARVAAQPIDLIGGADLHMISVDAPERVLIGRHFDLTFSVANDGSVDAPSPVWHSIYWSADGVYDFGVDIPIYGASYSEHTYTVGKVTTHASRIRVEQMPGPGFLLILVDAGRRQPEIDETNNITAVPLHVAAKNELPAVSSFSVEDRVIGRDADPITPDPFTLTIDANDADGTLNRIEIYHNDRGYGAPDPYDRIGTIYNPDGVVTFTADANNWPLGQTSLFAVAFDDLNVPGEPVEITPTVGLKVAFGDDPAGVGRRLGFQAADRVIGTIDFTGQSGYAIFSGRGLFMGRNHGLPTVHASGALTVERIHASSLKPARLKVSTRGGDGSGATIVDLDADYSVVAIDAADVSIAGQARIRAEARTLRLGDLLPGSTLHVVGTHAPPIDIRLDRVADATVTSDRAVRGLRLTDWRDTDDQMDLLKAPSIGSLTVTGDRRRGVAGVFEPGVVLHGRDPLRPLEENFTLLRSSRITGDVGGAWSIAGDIGSIFIGATMRDSGIAAIGSIRTATVGRMTGSHMLAGMREHVMSLTDPVVEFDAVASIGSLRLRGDRAHAGPWFEDSLIAASDLGAIHLGPVGANDAAAPFGLAGRLFRSIQFSHGTDRFKIASAEALSSLTLPGDMLIRLV